MKFIDRNPSAEKATQIAKLVSLVVIAGALVFIPFIPTKYAIYLQLLGGIWIIQTLPAVMFGTFTRWFNSWALLIGWAVGIGMGTWMAIASNLTPTFPVTLFGFSMPGYSALYTVIINLVIAIVLTPVFNAISRDAADETSEADYLA